MRTALSVALLACALAACVSTQPHLVHEPSRESVDEVAAARGLTYTATLPFNAGTGYAWAATSYDGKVVKLAGQSSRRAAGEAIPGGPMIEEFRFDLVGRGETIIVFELKRPWERNVPAADVRSVKVTVK